MHRDRITVVALSLTLALGAAVSCTDSEPINNTNQTGQAGATSTGAAGNATGAAGAGNTGGTAGTTGAAGAGNTGGTAGTTGMAGSTTGTAGAGNTGGTAGTTGTAGSTAGSGGSTAGTTGTGGAGGGAAGTGGGATVSFATDIYPFLMTQCMPCHTKATNQDGGPLNLSSAMAAYTSFVGTGTGAAAKTDTGCKMLDTMKLRVSPGDPMHSYFYIKITNSDATLMGMNCGPAMPETASKLTLTADQKQKVSDWIMQGAKNN